MDPKILGIVVTIVVVGVLAVFAFYMFKQGKLDTVVTKLKSATSSTTKVMKTLRLIGNSYISLTKVDIFTWDGKLLGASDVSLSQTSTYQAPGTGPEAVFDNNDTTFNHTGNSAGDTFTIVILKPCKIRSVNWVSRNTFPDRFGGYKIEYLDDKGNAIKTQIVPTGVVTYANYFTDENYK